MNDPSVWAWAIPLKPFVALAVFLPAVMLGRWILRRLPEGRLKRLLSLRVGP